MRITRAAKVAAFPLIVLALVALIACQGPAGPSGDAGVKGDTGAAGMDGAAGAAGAAGMDAFQALSVPIQFFRTQAGEGADDSDGIELDPINLNDYVANATGTVSFEIIDDTGWISPSNYDLDGSMLMLRVVDDFAPATPTHDDDAVIRIEATDNDDSAVLYVRVRANINPAGTGTLALTIGTQNAPADDSEEPDYVDSEDETGARVTCEMLNSCTVDLVDVMGQTDVFTDANIRDELEFHARVSAGSEFVVAEATGTGVKITGRQAGTATVVVWVTDEAGMPMLPEEDDEDTEADETLPVAGASYVITVTVDRAPYLSSAAVGSVRLAVSDDPRVVGNVFDEALDDVDVTFTPIVGEQNDEGGIAEITEGTVDTTATPNRLPFSVNGINPGTVTLTVKATEGGAQNNEPIQYAEHTITVTVTADPP